MVSDVYHWIRILHRPSRRLNVSFIPQIEMSQLVGLAIFGFFTGFGSAFATLTVHYLVEKMRENAKRSFNIVKNHTKKEEDSP